MVCYAESTDGLEFVKPALGLFDFRGEKDTNIVVLGSGGYGDRYGASVLVDAREASAAKRYKMLYTDFGRDAAGQEWPGFFAAFSPDGVRWTAAEENPLNHTAYGGR